MCARKTLLCVAIVVGMFAASASAETVRPFINGLPVPHNEHFNDFSWERVLDNNLDGLISAGDTLEGVLDFESIGQEAGSGANRLSVGHPGDPVEVTGYFRLAIQSVTNLGIPAFPFYAVQLGPDPAFEATYGQGALAVAFEDAANDFSAGLAIPQLIANATNGTHLVTLAFTGAGGTPVLGEAWVAGAQTNSIALSQAYGSAAFGFYQANVGRILSPGLANALWTVPITQSQPSPFVPGTFTDFSVNGQLYGSRSGSTLPLSDSAEVFFTVPEPATLVGLLMGALALLASAWVGRKR